ncbi:hypothetical protein FF011L_06220 [Roseimaritima multifibrata]|uniref:Uncharacterized protein n=1 Tax=Roseimaritima multifibrata TaxID=1930274 RepID=A0A517MAH8_9BACT|nr:hypothetical protein [Roseimaritima multifibrata]QDS91886.1 hypothetical protein FF011L_06220 [Roseimaritima multifibrata]
MGKKKPLATPDPTVSVSYDWGSKGQRRTKTFDDAHAAKAFYTAKDKAGKNPKVAATTDDTTAPAPRQTPPNEGPPSLPGVRPMRTRPYLAGVVVAKHGLAAGVTDAMVAELDAAYGKPNPVESKFCLKNAHHAARGFLGLAADAIA